MNKLLQDCFTGRDNLTYDLGRILWGLGCLVYMGLSIAHVFLSHIFDYQNFGIGLGAALTGGGLGIHLKKSTEPEN